MQMQAWDFKKLLLLYAQTKCLRYKVTKTLLKEGYLLTRYQDPKPRKGREPWERDAPWNMP